MQLEGNRCLYFLPLLFFSRGRKHSQQYDDDYIIADSMVLRHLRLSEFLFVSLKEREKNTKQN